MHPDGAAPQSSTGIHIPKLDDYTKYVSFYTHILIHLVHMIPKHSSYLFIHPPPTQLTTLVMFAFSSIYHAPHEPRFSRSFLLFFTKLQDNLNYGATITYNIIYIYYHDSSHVHSYNPIEKSGIAFLFLNFSCLL